ncbi:GntR family transcriptional regulator [candidate division KSB3 bacterium]|uniref:GntR family transcriptional regulator n=1 Tax=candidate division KSB3 bacterium TaxID=2044937 RepID=A0A9D5JZ46_9BACT|nr:GntR family transcriptional regulator [candidate division KSB3 bacterium]MBD3326888.1 GntR family transcriptional regulator [candidate division KSB3 bacterium]
MKSKKLIDHIQKIEIQKPADLIIQQIQDLITSGVLRPGDRLPSEPKLAKAFEVGRGQVREALKRLEFYGVLTTVPQTGTFVSSMGVKAIEGVISNILHLEKGDFASLVDTRTVLEIHSAELAARRATEDEIEIIAQAHDAFCQRRQAGDHALDEDIYFHLKISEYAHSSVLASLIAMLTPDIMKQIREFDQIEHRHPSETMKEHTWIVEAIQGHDAERAGQAMGEHMQHTQLIGEKLGTTLHRDQRR